MMQISLEHYINIFKHLIQALEKEPVSLFLGSVAMLTTYIRKLKNEKSISFRQLAIESKTNYGNIMDIRNNLETYLRAMNLWLHIKKYWEMFKINYNTLLGREACIEVFINEPMYMFLIFYILHCLVYKIVLLTILKSL